jgi:hypothetical protein
LPPEVVAIAGSPTGRGRGWKLDPKIIEAGVDENIAQLASISARTRRKIDSIEEQHVVAKRRHF